MTAVAELGALGSLDRQLLHVFVAGPGYGEGVAVALPERGWLLVDECLADQRQPLLSIVERWRHDDDPVDCLALTHPHKDHAQGFRRVLEETSPSYVGLTAPPGNALSALAGLAPGLSGVTNDVLKRRAVLDALAAIQRFATARPSGLLALCAGSVVPTTSARVDVIVRSPAAEQIAAELAAHRLSAVADPNELSAVFEINFGAGRVVLGSDLSTAGWSTALTARPEMAAHIGLKIPHHGSPTGHHRDLMMYGTGRAWVVAPFSPSHLPSVESEGLPWLVAQNGRVLLTAAPLAHYRQPFPPAEVAVDQLAPLFSRGAPAGRGAVAVSPPVGLRALDAVWAVAFDDLGAIRGLWRGVRAFAVVPATSGATS